MSWRKRWTGGVKSLIGVRRKSDIPTTRVLWTGKSRLDGVTPIMVVATCTGASSSANGKTGDMVQIAIWRQDMNPGETYQTGNDGAICPDACVHRSTARGGEGTCYVNKARLYAAWDAAKREIASGRVGWPPGLYQGAYLRFGMDGDPAAAPLWIWLMLAEQCAGHTGYTAEWREINYKDHGIPDMWRRAFMASCQSPEEAETARRAGWRTFTTTYSAAQDDTAPGIQCHADTPTALSCVQCRLCDGNLRGSRRPGVWIPVHGAVGGKKRA